MKLYGVGDIHGCYQELLKLMNLVFEDIGDDEAKIVFLGDYVDRGPDSALVVDYLDQFRISEEKNIEFVFLKGNHEDMLIQGVLNKTSRDQSDIFYYNGGDATMRSYQDNNFILEDHRGFYETLERYHRHGDFFFVHAGLSHSVSIEEAIKESFWYDDPLLWERAYNNHEGEFPENVFVVHGHTPVPDVFFLPNQINIDTGCVFGKSHSEQYGVLTAVRLDGRTKDEIKLIQVRKRFE